MLQASTLHGSALDGYTNYWNFDDKSLVDQMHPSVSLFDTHNISWVTSRRGANDSALYLNNGYIQINTSSVSWKGDFTIATWVHVKSQVSCGKLLDCGIKGQNELVINLGSCNGDGQSLQVYNNRSVSGLVYNRNRLTTKWQHVAFTFNHGKIVIFTDGVPVASGTTNVKPNVLPNYGTCFIGKSQWNNNPNINAYIDDLWMFNRGLSADEVQIVMNSSLSSWTSSSTISSTSTSTSTKTSSSTSTTTASLSFLTNLGAINYWKFSNNFADAITGLSFTATQNYSFVADRKGNANSAIYFNYGYGLLPAATYFDGALSIAGWISIISIENSTSRLLDCGSSVSNVLGGDNVVVHYGSTVYIFNTHIGSRLHGGPAWTANVWTHLAVTLAATGAANIYVNGTAAVTGTVTIPRAVNRDCCFLSKSNWDDGNANAYFDDVIFFNTKLSASSVQSVMNLYFAD